MGLRKKLANRFIGHQLQKINRTRAFRNLCSVKSAGILWKEQDYAAFDKLTAVLDRMHIDWTGLCYTENKKPDRTKQQFGKKDFSFGGKPENDMILSFIRTPFDVLFDISLSDSMFIQVIRSLSRASMKAGWSEAKPDVLDFRIELAQRRDPVFLVEQLLHYLRRIN